MNSLLNYLYIIYLFLFDDITLIAATNCIEATSHGNRTSFERVIYSTIEAVDTSTSIIIEMSFVDTFSPPPNMYLMVGRPLKPSLISGYYNPKYVKKLDHLTWDAGEQYSRNDEF